MILGYDANPERAEKLASFFQTPLPDDLSEGFLWELAEIRRELKVFSDIDRLFIRAPSFVTIPILTKILKGRFISDVVAILGSIDFVMGECDK